VLSCFLASMMWGAVTAQDTRGPSVGARVVKLNVEVKANGQKDCLTLGIKSLYEEAALCDVMLVAGNQAFPAHKAALATYPALRDRLQIAITDAAAAEAVAAAAAVAAEAAAVETAAAEAVAAEMAAAQKAATETAAAESAAAAGETPVATAEGSSAAVAPAEPEAVAEPVEEQGEPAPSPPLRTLEMHFPDISCPEAVRIMLAHIYGVDGGDVTNYAPSCEEANKDVLRLASQLQLPSLKEFATHWMASGLNSSNAVPRLATCQEFALRDLFEAATESLASDAHALSQVTEDIDIIKHPRLLQKLLIRFAALYPKSSKRDRTGDATEDHRASKKAKAFPQEGGA